MYARESGLTLIEVMVTIVVLAVGLLGIAGLYLTGMRSSHDGYLRTQATMAAENMIDRMRANRTGVSSGCYRGDLRFAVGMSAGDVPTAAGNCDAGTATNVKNGVQADFNAMDRLFNNRDSLSGFVALLPQGEMLVDCDAVGIICTVTVNWSEGDRDRATLFGFSTSVELSYRM